MYIKQHGKGHKRSRKKRGMQGKISSSPQVGCWGAFKSVQNASLVSLCATYSLHFCAVIASFLHWETLHIPDQFPVSTSRFSSDLSLNYHHTYLLKY